ncbi:MAG: LUD domain-containing protein [Bacteroidales bacterium]|jgi:L-lactate dehydrogenase complex protein LldG|nr:LUD domain-containing protein [Bacteroidales bacterium]
MEESTAREKILKKVRDALIEKTEAPYPIVDQEISVYKELTEPLDITFAEALVKAAGKFVYCESEDEFIGNLKSFILEKDWGVLFCKDPKIQHLLKQGGVPYESHNETFLEARIGITRCEYLIARLGTVMVSTRLSPGRKITVYPEIHLILGYTCQLVPDLKQALVNIKKKYKDHYPSMVSLITGPSRTADIEKTLVMGAHGPKEFYVFLIDDARSVNL